MPIKTRVSGFLVAALISASCVGTAVPASMCKIINIPIDSSQTLVPLFVSFANQHELQVVDESVGGIELKEKNNLYKINLTFLHSDYSVVAFYSPEAESTEEEMAALNQFINSEIGASFRIEECSDREGFRNPVLYGY